MTHLQEFGPDRPGRRPPELHVPPGIRLRHDSDPQERPTMETRQTGRIRAISDDGREFVILEYSSYPEEGSNGVMPREPSVVTFQTEECIPVHRVGEELYEVLMEPEPALARPRADAT